MAGRRLLRRGIDDIGWSRRPSRPRETTLHPPLVDQEEQGSRRHREGHGGDLEVESTPGEGTTMRLWLPEADAGVEEVAESTAAPAPVPAPGQTLAS